jgi:hypothetical protein
MQFYLLLLIVGTLFSASFLFMIQDMSAAQDYGIAQAVYASVQAKAREAWVTGVETYYAVPEHRSCVEVSIRGGAITVRVNDEEYRGNASFVTGSLTASCGDVIRFTRSGGGVLAQKV